MSLEALFCDIDGFCQNFLPQCLLYSIINDQGELLAFHLTPGNVDDRRPVPYLTQKLSGDKGHISKRLFQTLFEKGLQLITPIRKNRHIASCLYSISSCCADALSLKLSMTN